MLDVASHVAVAGNVRNLQTYRDAVEAMVTLGIVDAGLGEALEGAPGLRNALAHEYLNIDHQRVYAAMEKTAGPPGFRGEGVGVGGGGRVRGPH